MNCKSQKLTLLISAVLATSGCNKQAGSYSLIGDQNFFNQDAAVFQQRKVDILWVVDNSGSMESSQANLAANYSAFITKFQTLGIDYHMAVTTTDAYLADPFFNNQYSPYNPNNAKFRDGFTGTYGLGHSGITLMTSANTTASVFQKNMSEGTSGNGDERAFSSMIAALNDSTNMASGFRRSDAFLSVIILSDEDDFSGNATYADHVNPSQAQYYVGDHAYNVPAPYLQPTSFYVGLLDSYAGGHSNYSVSAIYTDSQSCMNTLDAQDPGSRVIATRYPQIAQLTKGTTGSLCGNWAVTLATITQSVLELASVFKLDRPAVPSTIVVTVNGVSVPNSATNGWTYDDVNVAVAFHGNAVPPASANIAITFTPTTVIN